MRRAIVQGIAGIVGVWLLGGCHAATRVTSMPRVDLALEGGNRGYLVGSPPPAAESKTTREMVETQVEIPSFYKPKRTHAPVGWEEEIAPPEVDLGQEGAAATAAGPYETYVVQKGDSLWSIAAKPEVYGKATQWRRLFDANRDLLKSPDRLRAGMTLKIPRGPASETSEEDEGTTFKK